jgi:4'-phosphopantetheinyl transferase
MELPMNARPTGRLDIWWKNLDAVPTRPGSVESRAILRSILRRYGRDSRIEIGSNGKPFLVGVDDLSVNLSHSERWLVVAVGDGAPIGVDCEAVRGFDDLRDVARLTLSEAELDLLNRADDISAIGIFYTLWTRKEALVKAIGVGLSFPLSELTVVADAAQAPLPLPLRIAAPGHGEWWLRSIDSPEGFAAACACRHPFEILPQKDCEEV